MPLYLPRSRELLRPPGAPARGWGRAPARARRARPSANLLEQRQAEGGGLPGARLAADDQVLALPSPGRRPWPAPGWGGCSRARRWPGGARESSRSSKPMSATYSSGRSAVGWALRGAGRTHRTSASRGCRSSSSGHIPPALPWQQAPHVCCRQAAAHGESEEANAKTPRPKPAAADGDAEDRASRPRREAARRSRRPETRRRSERGGRREPSPEEPSSRGRRRGLAALEPAAAARGRWLQAGGPRHRARATPCQAYMAEVTRHPLLTARGGARAGHAATGTPAT